MENMKQKISDFAHNVAVIALITMFTFGNTLPANALKVEPKTQIQLNKETLDKFSNTVYKSSDQLTNKELKRLLQAVGFEGKALKTAWAIAKRESHGRPMAYNGNRKTGDSSYGLFQINMLGQLGIDRKEKFELKSNVLLFDPVINAEITYHMTQGGNDWSSWPSHNTVEMKQWLGKFPN